MSKTRFLTSAFLGTVLGLQPVASQAGGMSHIGTPGFSHPGSSFPGGLNCRPGSQVPSIGFHPSNIINNVEVYKPVVINRDVNVYKPVTINNEVNVYKPVTVNKDVNIETTIDNSKNISIYKPTNITNNIDTSKNITINKPISIWKNIDNSKNININKTIIINKGNGNSEAEAQAEAVAIASAAAAAMANASSSSNAVINFNGSNSANANAFSSSASNSGSNAFSSAFGYSGAGAVVGANSFIAETPTAFVGGELKIDVSAPVVAPAPGPCTYEDVSVIKAIHAICISNDNHQFPASHMAPDTWINASYEGEIARCLPGSHLKLMVGKVMQSREGMAAGFTTGEVLECGAHEAARHYKDGIIRCAPAIAVPDCTERTNLRKYGTGDMFFSYRAKMCLETHEEYAAAGPADGRW